MAPKPTPGECVPSILHLHTIDLCSCLLFHLCFPHTHPSICPRFMVTDEDSCFRDFFPQTKYVTHAFRPRYFFFCRLCICLVHSLHCLSNPNRPRSLCPFKADPSSGVRSFQVASLLPNYVFISLITRSHIKASFSPPTPLGRRYLPPFYYPASGALHPSPPRLNNPTSVSVLCLVPIYRFTSQPFSRHRSPVYPWVFHQYQSEQPLLGFTSYVNHFDPFCHLCPSPKNGLLILLLSHPPLLGGSVINFGPFPFLLLVPGTLCIPPLPGIPFPIPPLRVFSLPLTPLAPLPRVSMDIWNIPCPFTSQG